MRFIPAPEISTTEGKKYLNTILNYSTLFSFYFKHLQNSEDCRASCSVDCFHILDHAPMSFQLKIKEAIHIQREQPSLNQQLHHVNLKLSL